MGIYWLQGAFRGTLAAAKWNGKWGYIDRSGAWDLSPRFVMAEDYSDGLALTNDGYVDMQGRIVASPKAGSSFVQGLANVSLGENRFGYIDHSGRVIFRYQARTERPSSTPYYPVSPRK